MISLPYQAYDTFNKLKLKQLKSNLDSSVGIQFQYLRSSIPVMAIAFADIDIQTLPVTLSIHTSCKNKTK